MCQRVHKGGALGTPAGSSGLEPDVDSLNPQFRDGLR